MVHAVPREPPLSEQIAIRRGRSAFGAGAVLQAPKIALFAAPAALVVALAWPMLFTDATLGGDWVHHLFLVWSQSRSIAAEHHPSLFLNNSHSVLYPQYAFYGGTIYVIAGTLSLLLGDAPVAAYVLTYLLGFAAAYGGWYWLARMVGLDRWRAQAPGLVFITSAYYITLIYERGDWPEFLAVSTIPLLVASGLNLLRAESLSLWPSVALVASTIVFTGSHILSLLWGSTCIALGAVLTLACTREARKWLVPRRVLRLVALLIPPVLLNAWFLLPLLAYHTHTRIGGKPAEQRATVRNFMSLVAFPHLFSIGRVTAVHTQRDFALNLPILAMAWIAIAAAIFLPGRLRVAWARMLLICSAMATLLIVLMTHIEALLALPSLYTMLEFSYRLDSYVLLWISGALLCALALMRGDTRLGRPLTLVLAPILAFGVLQAIHQVDIHTVLRTGPREASIGPNVEPGPRHVEFRGFMDTKLPLLVNDAHIPEVDFPPTALHDDRASVAVHLTPGQPVYTNVGGGPELVHVSGARIIGVTRTGNDVMQVGPSNAAGPAGRDSRPTEVISVSPAGGSPIVLGRLISLAALVLLLAALAVPGARALYSRGHRRA